MTYRNSPPPEMTDTTQPAPYRIWRSPGAVLIETPDGNGIYLRDEDAARLVADLAPLHIAPIAPPKPPFHWTPALLAEAVRLFQEERLGCGGIAKLLGCSRATAWNALRNAGVPRRSTPAQRQHAAAMRAKHAALIAARHASTE